VPTHKDLPDWYLDGRDGPNGTRSRQADFVAEFEFSPHRAPHRRGADRRRRKGTTALRLLLVLIVIMLAASAALLFAIPTPQPPQEVGPGAGTTRWAGTPARLPARPHGAQKGHSARSQAVRVKTAGAHRPRVTTAGAHRPPVTQLVSRSRPHTFTLARGVAMPGSGHSPVLVAIATSGRIEVHSRSRAPVNISISDGYGRPMRHLATLRSGQALAQTIVTGRRYGFCFSQAAAAGFRATRACGGMVTHSYLNGAKLPDGAATSTIITSRR
jgi:hypothetical protein